MNTETMLESYAEAGFRVLNERGPTDWVWRINEKTLCIAHPMRCVLGQVYQYFHVGKQKLGLESAIKHGFVCEPLDPRSRQNIILVSIWKRLILAERARQKAEVKEEAPALA